MVWVQVAARRELLLVDGGESSSRDTEEAGDKFQVDPHFTGLQLLGSGYWSTGQYCSTGQFSESDAKVLIRS